MKPLPEKILKSKRNLRRELALRSVGERLQILDAMRLREIEIRESSKQDMARVNQ